MSCGISRHLPISDIPIKEILSEVRIARAGGQFLVNPTRSELEKADMEFIIAATEKNLMMVEGEAKECSEEDLVKALQMAHDAIRLQIRAQEELKQKKGVTGKRDYTKPENKEELQHKVIAFAKDRVYQISGAGSSKHERSDAFDLLKDELIKSILGDEPDETDKKLVKKYFEDLNWEVVRNMIIDDRKRLDGRKLDQVRPLEMEWIRCQHRTVLHFLQEAKLNPSLRLHSEHLSMNYLWRVRQNLLIQNSSFIIIFSIQHG
jgi:polyribonucleotide nucleotidyltransferase